MQDTILCKKLVLPENMSFTVFNHNKIIKTVQRLNLNATVTSVKTSYAILHGRKQLTLHSFIVVSRRYMVIVFNNRSGFCSRKFFRVSAFSQSNLIIRALVVKLPHAEPDLQVS